VLTKMQGYFGFTTVPFGRGLAPGQLFRWPRWARKCSS
jgi:hypothetical protein